MACKVQKKENEKSPSCLAVLRDCAPHPFGKVRATMMTACPASSEQDSHAVTSERIAVHQGARMLVSGSSSADDVTQVRQLKSTAGARNKTPRLQADGVCYRRTCQGKLCYHAKSPVLGKYFPPEDVAVDAFRSRPRECSLENGSIQASGPAGSTSSAVTTAKGSSSTSVASVDIKMMLGTDIHVDDVPLFDTRTSLATLQPTSEGIPTSQSYDLGTCPDQPAGKGGTTLQACSQASSGSNSRKVWCARTTAVQGHKIPDRTLETSGGGTPSPAQPSGTKRTLVDHGFRVGRKG